MSVTEPPTVRVTILGTTDLHSHVLDWDYFTDAPYSDASGNQIGLARLSTLIKGVRTDRDPGTVLTVDNGDTMEGNPLAYYFARVAPGQPHPMATAMNLIGFDAAAIGNHEFNYGLQTLEAFAQQVDHPMLCANAHDCRTGGPAFTPYVLKQIPTEAGVVTVGILGLVTPGCAIWDKAVLAGRLRFTGVVEQARQSVPALRAAGADVVLVLCHSGLGPWSSYGDALPWPENAAQELAEEVAGIDAILVGHAHVEIGEHLVSNKETGRTVVLSEPLKWGMRLSVLDLQLQHVEGHWQVRTSSARLLNAADAEPDPAVETAVREQHEAVRAYVNGVIGHSMAPLSASRARFQASPVIDLINHVQARTVATALDGTQWAGLPVLAAVAAYNRRAGLPAGPVTLRDVAGLYNYENTLVGVLLTGGQLRAYLEHSARYYRQVSGAGPFAPAAVTNATSTSTPSGAPDYSYDMISGLEAPLAYDIDISRPAGSRLVRLDYADSAVQPQDQFVLAVNNYRQSGGGDYPGVTNAPVVYNELLEIRQLIIDWVRAAGTIDQADFARCAWRLVSDGQPVEFL